MKLKKLGVPMGAAAFEFQKMFDENNIHVFSSNYALYGDMSNRVTTLLAEFSPEIEVYSIDEAFLHFTGFETFYDYKRIWTTHTQNSYPRNWHSH
jgi:DNA polymerase V